VLEVSTTLLPCIISIEGPLGLAADAFHHSIKKKKKQTNKGFALFLALVSGVGT
jgi:hypothetical protein